MRTRNIFPKAFLFWCLIWVVSGCDFYDQFNQYNETHRPQYHFTPPNKWMGPPAAGVYFSGEYHLFYQQNRDVLTPGNTSWGHAVSKDLVHWEHISVAIRESENPANASGSVVVDWNNTAGFGSPQEPAMVAFYTVHEDAEKASMEQHLAYSADRGRTWTPYDDNPVMRANGKELMHPKVFWINSIGEWVMAAVYKDEKRIGIFGSSDLKEWKFLSDFESDDSTEGRWKSPEFFELAVDGDQQETRWVIVVNTEPESGSGKIGPEYFIGNFDGQKFTIDSSQNSSAWVDGGSDFYTPLTFSNVPNSDNRRIWLGWMNNWMYAEKIPTKPWKGALSIPREVKLQTIDEHIKMIQTPLVELRELRTKRQRFRDRRLTEESNFLRETGIKGTSSALIAEFEIGDLQKMGFELRRGENEQTIVGYDANKEQLFIDRSRSGQNDFDAAFNGNESAPLRAKNGRIKLRIFLDRSSIEVFGNEGEAVITTQIFPSEKSEGMALYVRGGEGRLLSLDIWQLQGIW